MIRRIVQFLREVRNELANVTWPTKEELIGSTVAVLLLSLIMAIFIGLVDRFLTFLFRTLYGG
ncbi:MAG: preprotein translocase subunit SecE [Candidatus Latescibacterota bacterium]|nr:MAG: preprotein translocase subunit SecE [Candidatus Latescibacterota bacterium]